MIIYRFIKYCLEHRRFSTILKKIYKEENLIDNLSQLFGTNFKIDWIGRLYTVINPNLMDIKDQIYEYNDKGFDNTEYIEREIMIKLNIISDFIHANNLFELLTYDIKKLDDYGNYLFVIEPITLKDYLKYTKLFLLELLVIGLGIGGWFIFF